MKRFTTAAVALVAVLAFGAAGCGSQATEKLAEKAIEEGTGGDVDVDVDSGGDQVKITDKDGNVSEYGAGAELPEGWPADLAPADDVEVVSATSSTSSGKNTLMVTAQSSAAYDDVVAGIKSQLTDAGYEVEDSTTLDSGDGEFATIAATGPDFTASVSVASNTQDGTVALVYSLTEV